MEKTTFVMIKLYLYYLLHQREMIADKMSSCWFSFLQIDCNQSPRSFVLIFWILRINKNEAMLPNRLIIAYIHEFK